MISSSGPAVLAVFTAEVSHVLTALVVPLVLGGLLYLARRRATVQVREGRLVLRYSWGMMVLAILAVALAGFVAFVALQQPADQGAAAALVALLFIALALVLGLEVIAVRVEFDAETIWCFSPWRRKRVIPWAEVERISYSVVNQWWIARTREGRLGSIRLSSFLTGVDDFLTTAESRGIPIDRPARPSGRGR